MLKRSAFLFSLVVNMLLLSACATQHTQSPPLYGTMGTPAQVKNGTTQVF